ncbi:MAG: DUF4118 domain-containing protein [Vicinamibacterales bacterium]
MNPRTRLPSPLALVVATLAATAMTVVLVDRLFGFPPLLLLAVPIAMALAVDGMAVVIFSVAATAIVGDFFFVEPVHRVTVHAEGLRLLATLAVTAAVASRVWHRPRRV